MPSRWFVPIPAVQPDRVRLEHVHAAFSRWFDHSGAEHTAGDKPYTVSPLTRNARGATGVEIATLTDLAEQRLLDAAAHGTEIRLGNQIRTTGPARLMFAETWQDLAGHDQDSRWQLAFLTPTTWRTGERSSPLPRVETILDNLLDSWQTWADAALPGCGQPWADVWASDLNLTNTTLRYRVRHGDTTTDIVISGALGDLTLRCDDQASAARAGPLLRAAAYTGIGGMTAKGLGVTRVTAYPASQPAATNPAASTQPAAPRAPNRQTSAARS